MDEVKVKRKGNTVEITAVHRLKVGQKVRLKTTGWGNNTYAGEVLAFVPKNKPLKDVLPEMAKINAIGCSSVDRYLVKATGHLCLGEFHKPRYFAPLASRLEKDNERINK